MPAISEVCKFLDLYAPTRLAEEWDNVGLLVGDTQEPASKIMTCLTITPDSAKEAIDRGANMIVTHHPLPFRPLKRLTTDTTASRLVYQLIRAGVAIYSPHTGFDSAKTGINQMHAEDLQLSNIKPLNPIKDDPDGLGSGRCGSTSKSLNDIVQHYKQTLGLDGLHIVGDLANTVSNVAIACGSGGSFLQRAIAVGCDTLITGETTFHTCLEAEATGTNLVLLGHFASERFALERMAEALKNHFAEVEIWASEKESDPLKWV